MAVFESTSPGTILAISHATSTTLVDFTDFFTEISPNKYRRLFFHYNPAFCLDQSHSWTQPLMDPELVCLVERVWQTVIISRRERKEVWEQIRLSSPRGAFEQKTISFERVFWSPLKLAGYPLRRRQYAVQPPKRTCYWAGERACLHSLHNQHSLS